MKTELIKLENVSVKYNTIEALHNLNLTINKGEFLGIIGPNGGGKSTLLRTILNLIKPYEGTIKYLNSNLKKSGIRLGYVPQLTEINRIFPITVKEVVLTAKIPSIKSRFYRFSKQDHAEVDEVIKKVDIENIADRQISDLSGGEFQKMLIARAIALNPDILLLDEPTAMIDVKSQKQIYSIIEKLSKEMTIILVTHHLRDIVKYAEKLVFLEKNVIAEGNPEEVYRYAYLKPVSAIRRTRHKKEVSPND